MDPFKKKLLIEISVTLGIIAVLAGSIIFLSGTISDYTAQIATIKNQLAIRSSSLNAFASLRSQYSSAVNADLQLMNATVPIKDQLINLTKEFQLLASQNGLSSSFAFISETPATVSSFGTIRFKLDVTGDFQKLVAFVPALQSFKFLSSFDTYSITRTAGDNGNLSTVGQIYFKLQ